MSAPSLKERLAGGQVCTGTFVLFLAGGDVAQCLAGLGFDYFILDTEHSAFDLRDVRQTVLAARASGIAPLVRVPDVHYDLVARVLDAGAEGVMAPRVETRQQVESLVRFSRYPPAGVRGISTFTGHNDFTRIADVPTFLAERNARVMVLVQIETVAGVANRQEILSTPGLDACFVGTGDLAMGMGYAGQPDHPAVREAARQVLQTCRECGLIATVPVRHPDHVEGWR
ncbi:MAG: aldolase/citrate lyase family protein, partial [Candidatus Latescibacterota bacterium]